MIVPIIFIFCLLSSPSSSRASVFDFCVANYTAPSGPTGYSCKNPTNVTVKDFTLSGLNIPGNTSNIFRVSITPAFVDQLPGLNGIGLSLGRVDYEVGGVVPIHTHPGASETLIVLKGNITAGFISSNNTVYLKPLTEGEVIVFPQGLLHFHINEGNTSAVAIVNYNSPNPTFQYVDLSLFASDLLTQVVKEITFINPAEVQRLKLLFGGSG